MVLRHALLFSQRLYESQEFYNLLQCLLELKWKSKQLEKLELYMSTKTKIGREMCIQFTIIDEFPVNCWSFQWSIFLTLRSVMCDTETELSPPGIKRLIIVSTAEPWATPSPYCTDQPSHAAQHPSGQSMIFLYYSNQTEVHIPRNPFSPIDLARLRWGTLGWVVMHGKGHRAFPLAPNYKPAWEQ